MTFKTRQLFLVSLIAFSSALGVLESGAVVPQVLNHQGRIAVAGVNFNGNGQFKFALVNANGSTSYWSNDGTSTAGAAPSSPVLLTVTKGLYSVLLGDTTLANMTALPASALDHDDVRLRVWFNDGSRGFQQISPDQRLAATPYAFHAKNALAAEQAVEATRFTGLLSGDVSGPQSSTSIANQVVTGKLLTGFTSSIGTTTEADSILSALGKLHGNAALLAPLESPSFTGTVNGITASMVGLGNVSNTSDANKPISTAQLTALDLKANLANPTFTGTVSGITASMVGLGNVSNTSDANKPVSTAQLTALNLKANLANPTFTGTVSGITASMVGLGNVSNTTDANKPVSTAQQTALDLKANLANPTFTGTVSGITASMVGLGNVSNTTDANKPVSTAQQTALNLKANLASPVFTGTVLLPAGSSSSAPLQLASGTSLTTPVFGSVEFDGTNLFLTNDSVSPTRKALAFTDGPTFTGVPLAPTAAAGTSSGQIATTQFVQSAIQNVVGSAPAALNTLNELAGALNNDASYASTITNALSLKAPLASPTFTGTTTGNFSGPLTGNVTGNVTGSAASFTGSLAGDVTGTQSATSISAATVTGKNLTGYVSGAGTLSSADTILTAINKLNGNDALKANLASPTFTGTVSGITASMVGLGNVSNTSDANKPVSTAQQTALDLKANLASPTFTGTVSGITASMVGLGNVSNTSDANKPVSTAQQTALDLKANLANPTFTGTVSGITASMVGLGNVSNTTDANKPVSTAQQTALDLKANLANPTFTGTVSFPAGSASTAPLRLATGTNLTAAVFGSIEFDGTNLYLTNNSATPTRKTIAFTDSAIANGAVGSSQLASGLTLGGTTTGTFSGPLTGNVTGNVSGSAASFTGALLGDVTGTQSATAISAATVTGKALTGYASGAGTLSATDTILTAINKLNGNDALKANLASPTFTGTTTGTFSGPLTGNVTGNVTGSAASFTGALLGDVTGTQSATAISAATVTGKALTGYASGAGTLSATDTILTAINKLNGNDALKANLASPTFTGTTTGTFSGPLTGNVTGNVSGSAASFTGALLGDVTGTQSATAISAATVTGKALTGYVSSAGTLSATDTILTAINKLNGNDALKANLASPTFTGTVSGITASMVGLGNVSNTSDAGKPVSTAQQTALDLKANLANPTFTGTVSGITASMVGLGSVNNTSDAGKPVSTLQQAALDLKSNLTSPTFSGTVSFPAGTALSAPLKLTAGTNLTSASFGAVEFDGANLYLTTNSTSPTRKTLAFTDSVPPSVPTTNLTTAPIVPVVAWGNNGDGQTSMPALANVAAVAAGESHSLVLLDAGTVVARGLNTRGQVTVPAGLTGVTEIAAGTAHNLVRKSDGTLVSWGDNSYGQTTIPSGITTATRVAAGEKHSLALLANGSVRVWGDNSFGQTTLPASLTGATITAIAAGSDHSLALKSDGTVIAWGRNDAAQVTLPSGLVNVVAIAAGAYHSLALKSDGTVIAWGWDNGGQSTVPAGLSGVSKIAGGYAFSMALKTDGTLVLWGDNSDGQTTVPAAATKVTHIAAGASHALALRADAITAQVALLDQDNVFTGKVGIQRSPATNALEVNGNASKSIAGSWLSNSDRRIKTDIESISGALEKLDQVRLVDFRYHQDYLASHPEIEDRRYPNVIAQEFAKVFPDDVKSSGETLADGSEILQVDTYPLTIYSAAAVQELHQENKRLKAQLADQEQRLRKLEEGLKDK